MPGAIGEAEFKSIGASNAGTGAFTSLSATSYAASGVLGVMCSGTPTASLATTNGIVTHC